MTQERDIRRILDDWLAVGATIAPDRVIDVVTERIEHQRQRRRSRFFTRRPIMEAQLRPGVALAAVLVLSLGAVYLAGSAKVNRPDATSLNSSAPTAAVPTSPVSTPVLITDDGRLFVSDIDPNFVVDARIGWEQWRGRTWFSLKKSAESGPFPVEIVFSTYRFNESDPLGCHGPAETAPPPTVDALITAVSTDPRISTTASGPLTVDGHPGQFVDIELAPSWTGTCVDSVVTPAAYVHSLAYLRAGDKQRLILVDVRDRIIAITLWGNDAASFDAAVAEAMPIVRSMQFMP